MRRFRPPLSASPRRQVVLVCDRITYGPTPPHARQRYLNRHGCARWTDGALRILVGFSPVVEVGAGAGHWVREIRLHGGHALGYDTFEDATPGGSEDLATGGEHPLVTRGDHTALAGLVGHTLLLVYPPPPPDNGAPCMGVNALDLFEGDRVVYVGEGRGGTTASPAFFDRLEARWQVVHIETLKPFARCHERMYILERRK